jgi:hypothetical protein
VSEARAIPSGARLAAAGVSATLVISVVHGVGGRSRAAFIASAVILALTWAISRGRSTPVSGRDRLVAGLLLALIAAAALFTVAFPVDEFDAVAIWYSKTRALASWRPLPELPYPAYPDLGPTAWALLLRATGAEQAGRLIFLALYAAWALSVSALLDRPLPRAAAWIVPMCVLATFDYRAVTSGYQDMPIAALAGLAAVLLGRSLTTGDRTQAALGLFFAGVMGMVKLEGVFLGAILAASWMLASCFAPRQPSAVRRVGLLAAFAAPAAVWPALVAFNRIPLESFQGMAFEGIRPSDLISRFGRLPQILAALVHLGPTYLCAVGATTCVAITAWRRRPPVRPLLEFLSLAVAVHTAWIVAVFMLTNDDLVWHLETALSRLVFQQTCLWTTALIVAGVTLLDEER